nr:cystatin-B-like [Pocillopora verrucosa]
MACGAPGQEMKANEEVQTIVNEVKSQAEAKAGTTFNEFKAISYRTQLVAGTNYFVKVKVGDLSYVHLRIYQTLPHAGSTLELTAIKTELSEGDSLDYF